jgi:phosphatidylglycerol:prolipoprotein diacylglycerol transferase
LLTAPWAGFLLFLFLPGVPGGSGRFPDRCCALIPPPRGILAAVHPVLLHFGSVVIPSYGALAAVGALAALFLAQSTARQARLDPGQVWNLCVAAMFSGLIGERLVLLLANWSAVRAHPSWILEIAMIHHPLVAGSGIAAGAAAVAVYIRLRRLPARAVADALAAPLALGLAFEQLGALLAGAGYGAEASPSLPWAVTYTSVLAARWSGTPLGVPLHPAQAYAAIGFFLLAILLLFLLPVRRQAGDAAGLCLLGLGVVIYFTEIWRDPEGRGSLLRGAIDGPQLAAALLVIAGGLLLREREAGA